MKHLLILALVVTVYLVRDAASGVSRPKKPPREHTREKPPTTTPEPELLTTEKPDEREWESNENIKVSDDEKEKAEKFFDGFDSDNLADEPDPEVIINLAEVVDFDAKTPFDVDELKIEGMYEDTKVDRFIKNPAFDQLVQDIQPYLLIFDSSKNHFRLSPGPHADSRIVISFDVLAHETVALKLRVEYLESTPPIPSGYVMEVNHNINMIRDTNWPKTCASFTGNPVLAADWGRTCVRSHGVVMYQQKEQLMVKSCFEVGFISRDVGFVLCFSAFGKSSNSRSDTINNLIHLLTVRKGENLEGLWESEMFFKPRNSKQWISYTNQLPNV